MLLTNKNRKKNTNTTLITCALPYANDRLHLGHLYSTFIPADVYTRVLRQDDKSNQEIIFISGTDAFGTPIVLNAIKNNTTPEKIHKFFHSQHKKDLKFMNVKFDLYNTTNSNQHKIFVKKYILQLKKTSSLFIKEEELNYCNKDMMYLSERFLNFYCMICNKTFEFENQCEHTNTSTVCSICNSNTNKVNKPMLCFKMKEKNSYKVLNRLMSWGVPIDKKYGVVYVWFEALLYYVSYSKTKIWQNRKNQLVQFFGKDNLFFHKYLLPCFYPYKIKPKFQVGNFLLIDGMKFSKSKQIGYTIDYFKNINSDIIRFYLIYIHNKKDDSNFSLNHLEEITKNVLIDKILNTFQRFLHFLYTKKITVFLPLIEKDEEVKNEYEQYKKFILSFEFKPAIETLIKIVQDTNNYMREIVFWSLNENSIFLVNIITKLKFIILILQSITPNITLKLNKIFFNKHKNLDCVNKYKKLVIKIRKKYVFLK